ncbi:MAG TPA: type II toxin-antitoxin system VapC family toxin [Crenalkalicoccus sp.]|nr:type II toxin-antitoxin system VapC family toxin [Crenalkalicoccus sp.]
MAWIVRLVSIGAEGEEHSTDVLRIDFPLEELDTVLARAGFDHLPIEAGHAVAAGGLPRHHADPFDRMLIAQARLEGLTLVSDDAAFAAYDVRLLGREEMRE